MKKVNYLAASMLALSASLAHAQGYIGASVGQSDIDISGFDNGTSFALTGGYKFIENFALEASYINLGDTEDNVAPVWTISVDGVNLSAVGFIPVHQQIDLYAKVGLFIWDASLNEAGYGEIGIDDGTDISFGLGAAVYLTPQLGLLIEYQKFVLDEVDVNNVSLGARFYF